MIEIIETFALGLFGLYLLILAYATIIISLFSEHKTLYIATILLTLLGLYIEYYIFFEYLDILIIKG